MVASTKPREATEAMRIVSHSLSGVWGRALASAIAVGLIPGSARAQLADCTIAFDFSCPTANPECGALFSGGVGCVIDFLGFCYDTNTQSYRVDDGQTATIALSDDLNKLSVFFSGFGTGTGEMRFFDGIGVEVDSPLLTNGNCGLAMPPKQVVVLSRAVRSIEVTATGGRVYVDTFRTNPVICGDGILDAGEACDDGNAIEGDGCDGSCMLESPPECVCGDFDKNGTVDLLDFGSFAVCFGANTGNSPECTCMDMAANGMIDLLDFGAFALLFGGSTTNVPPDCSP